jgi:Ca2+/Na+ antiporter
MLYATGNQSDDFFPPGVQSLVGEGMNTHHEKERVQKTTLVYLVVMVLVVALILIAVSNPTFKAVASILVVLVCAIAIIIQWMLLGKRPEGDKEPVQQAQKVEQQKAERVSTQTGAPCEVSGQYHCSEHPERKVSMEEGKRFPPCRGDNKGHSATWILEA